MKYIKRKITILDGPECQNMKKDECVYDYNDNLVVLGLENNIIMYEVPNDVLTLQPHRHATDKEIKQFKLFKKLSQI